MLPERCPAGRGQGVGIHVVAARLLRGALDGRGARIAETRGCGVIDINMGCLVRHVTARKSGSALMRDSTMR